MKRVMVTGATGFIGRHCLADLEARGFEVHAVSSRSPERPSGPADPRTSGVQWHRADLLERGAAEALVESVAPSHVLHLAWFAVPGRFWTAPDNLRWLEVTVALLRALQGRGGRFVGAGTCAEYGPSGRDCREAETPLRPATLYGACKHSAQVVADALNSQSFSTAWGRVFHLYGPHEHPDRLVPSVIRSLLAARPAECTPGTQVRDFMHVQDVAAAFVALLDTDVRGAVNIASGRAVTVAEVVEQIGRAVGAECLVKLGAKPMPPGEPPRLTADVGRLAREVGWSPSRDLERGLDETVHWWRTAGAAAC